MENAENPAREHVIFHVDVNSAFLSWTAVDRLRRDPDALDLRTVPSVVGGDEETRHGIVTAKSIPAKKYGIRTADTVASAMSRCPGLIVVRDDFAVYRKYSRAFLDILRKYSGAVEQASIDEAYVDMTGQEGRFISGGRAHADCAYQTSGLFSSMDAASGPARADDPAALPFPLNAAYLIKNEIRDTLGFTVNIGISSNKLLAKTASDFEKPNRVHTLWPEEVPEKLWPLPIGELFGCGRSTERRLQTMGIHTIGDAAHTDEKVLKASLGEKSGAYIWNAANGIGSVSVRSTPEEAKGYSNETTMRRDITRHSFEKEAPGVVKELSEHVSRRLIRDGVLASTIGIAVKTDGFHRHSRQMQLDQSTNRANDIYLAAMKLLRNLAYELFEKNDNLRLIGVSATKLDTGQYRQMSLADYARQVEQEKRLRAEREKEEERKTKLNAMMQKIRGEFGDGAVVTGADLRKRE